MKKLLLFIIALLISVFGFSQNHGKESSFIKKPTKERIERPSKSYSDMDWKEQQQFLQTLNKKEQTIQKQLNSSKAMKQCLDSIILPEHYKTVYTYDEKGQTSSIIYFNTGIVKSETWDKDMKKEYEYDAKGNVILYATYYWNDVNNDWLLSNKEEFKYDNSGNLLVYIYWFWYSDILQNAYKEECTYDKAGNEITNIRYDWDFENNNWLMLYKGEAEYDNFGNVLLYIDSEWIEDTWVEYYKIENTYNENGYIVSFIIYDWIVDTWQSSCKGKAEYDTHGNEISWIEFFWDGDDWIEFINYKTEYEYDTSGNITLQINFFNEILWGKSEYKYDLNNYVTMSALYGWDEEINDWIGWSKYDYEYEDANVPEPTTLIEYFWNWDSKDWVEIYKYDNTYDVAGNLISQIHYYWVSSDWALNNKLEITIDLSYSINDLVIPSDIYMKNKLLFIAFYYWDGTDFIETSRETYYWSAKDIIGISDNTLQKTTITVYPNPTTGQLRITNYELQITNVEIYDIYGKKISSNQLINSSSNQIDISHLPAGVYFVRVDGQTVKVLKQ